MIDLGRKSNSKCFMTNARSLIRNKAGNKKFLLRAYSFSDFFPSHTSVTKIVCSTNTNLIRAVRIKFEKLWMNFYYWIFDSSWEVQIKLETWQRCDSSSYTMKSRSLSKIHSKPASLIKTTLMKAIITRSFAIRLINLNHALLLARPSSDIQPVESFARIFGSNVNCIIHTYTQSRNLHTTAIFRCHECLLYMWSKYQSDSRNSPKIKMLKKIFLSFVTDFRRKVWASHATSAAYARNQTVQVYAMYEVIR